MRFVLSVVLMCLAYSWVPTVAAQAGCASGPQADCGQYATCFEAACKCAGTSAPYVATFGPKYCGRFQQATSLSAGGKAWRDKTLKCLLTRGAEAFAAEKNGCNCGRLQSAMVGSHTTCYVSDPSFCELSDADVRAVAAIVEPLDLWAIDGAAKEAAKTFVECVIKKGADRSAQIVRVFAVQSATTSFPAQAAQVNMLLQETALAARDAASKAPAALKPRLNQFAASVDALRAELFPLPPKP